MAGRRSRQELTRYAATLAVIGAGTICHPSGTARAFHDDGVAACVGCHIMHASDDGISTESSEMLLRGSSATDVCLSCHANANGAVLGSDPLNPPPELGAGNFVFLLEDNLNDAPGGTFNVIPGHHAGHNVVSLALGISEDPDHLTAPGGTYPSRALGCTSCHDPHGSDEFRMLRGIGPIAAGDYTFVYPAPRGEGIPLDGGPESPTLHTAYQSGWTEWCANCHGLDEDHVAGFDHEADHSFEGSERGSYGLYGGTDNPTGGAYSTAYLPDVPFEDPAMTISSTWGPRGSSRLSCMSCHRAHATSAPGAGRWDFNVDTLGQDGLASGSYAIPNPFSDPGQRQLCMKCHYEVAQDHGLNRACIECHREEHF